MSQVIEEKPGIIWIILGIVLFLLNLFVVGFERTEFPYGLVYSLGFMAVGLTLTGDKPSLVTALSSTIIGGLSAWIQVSLASYTDAQICATISVVFLFTAVLGELFSLLRTSFAKYLAVVSLLSWFFFPATYFYQRITLNMPLPIETILYHGGVLLLSLIDTIILLINPELFKRTEIIRLIIAVATIIGAVLLTVVLGWGLQIYS